MTRIGWLILPVALVCLIAITGCGGDSGGQPLDMGGEDGTKIATLLEDVNDAVGNPKKLDTLFAKGVKPADPKKFAKNSYSIVGKPSVSGTTATAKVRVDPAGGGTTLGEVEWTFEKDGDKWKIKNAPIP